MSLEGQHMKRIVIAALAVPALSLAAVADEASDDGAIVAAKVRSQGFECAEPVTATRDEAQSKPDQAVYVLSCANATYTVQLVPDEAAKITVVP
jgi:hypothetical protein